MTSIPPLSELSAEVSRRLREQGGLAAVMLDLVALARIERGFGEKAYQAARAQIEDIMAELRQRVRKDDLLVREGPETDRFLLLLGRRRDGGSGLRAQSLRTLADRIEDQVAPRAARLVLAYLRDREAVEVGYGLVLHSPLEREERHIHRLVEECRASGELRRRWRERRQRDALIEIIHNREVWNAFQPIVEIENRRVLGYEGLSRGPRGSEFEPAMTIFPLAARLGLLEELERTCRRQVFVDWEHFGSPGRLFMNTVPATIRDPSFLGKGVLDYLGANLSPRMVTLEISERVVIENLSLYREAMHAFQDLGFTFAIDDVGAGYSGLETMASLGASFLKVDRGLVHDIHQKRVNQQVMRAILDMAHGSGSTVIAEGVETKDEAQALLDLGIRFGQGYLFARPIDPYAQRR
ncbi:MAG TPA: EAL domain-containing protein [Vicinamibacteria bacterium]|jgi:EAL domain-containing protein (putative c-di-GMP-specific phosphodiesterase class I)